jgi:trk system potassium uptake protein
MKFCVIGLGRFGFRVATTLAENGMEVLGVDSNESIVASIRDQITQAICIRITDEGSLRSIGIEEMDTIIVAMGENFAQSILVTALLKKRLNIPQVITRAVSEIHKEILKLIGADHVVLPEQEIGIKLADNLSAPFRQLTRLSKEFGISQLTAPKRFVGKIITDLQLFDNYSVRCIGIKKNDDIISLADSYVVQAGDKLVFAGTTDKLAVLAKV